MLIFEKMLTLLLLMTVGYFFYKLNWVTDNGTSLISKIVLNVANPAMMITAGLSSSTSISNMTLLYTLFTAIFFYAFLLVTAPLVVKIFRIPVTRAGTFKYMYVFGNVGFMGIPLITSVYGSEYALLLSIFNFCFNILAYTYGINLIKKEAAINSSEKDELQPGTSFQLKSIINAGTVGCLIALFCFFTKLQVPDFLSDTLERLGNLAAPLSMFVIGSSIAAMELKELVTDLHLDLFILVRMLVLPIIGIMLLKVFISSELLLRVFYVVISVPFATTSVIMAQEYGGDKVSASRGVALSTILSVITLPVIGLIFGF